MFYQFSKGSGLDFDSSLRKLVPHIKRVCTSGWALGGVCEVGSSVPLWRKYPMKIWSKPEVREQEVGLEVTSYLPAEIDII